MTISTFTSREFNQDVSKVKKAAAQGPVFITDRGHPAHVLLTIDEYLKLTKTKETIVDLLAMPDEADIDFEAPKIKGALYRAEEFD
jgi:prevent-host-death family protein